MEIEPLTFPGVDPKRPMIIAGPCSAESREQVLKTASELAARGVKIFRAGIWKPRTKPGGFEGIGVEGLPWMKQVKQETPAAKLYIFSGVQVITTNQAQKETLLRFLEMEEDICSAKINEIQEIKRQIEGESADV